MGVLQTIKGWLRKSSETSNLTSPAGWVSAMFGGQTSSGVTVTPDSAMRFAAAYACVRLISDTIATLPVHVYKRRNAGRELANSHPLYPLISRAMNDYTTAVEGWERLVAALCLRGNAYTYIHTYRGQVMGLYPLHPSAVVVRRAEDGGPIYDVGGKIYSREEIWHLKGLVTSANGLVGLSPVEVAAEAIGLGQTMERRAGNHFGEGVRDPVYLQQKEGILNRETARDAALDLYQKMIAPRAQSGVPLIPKEFELRTIDFSMKDAEFILSRKFQIEDVCRIWRVPPHKLALLDKATFSNIEHQAIEFVTDTIRPYLVRIEQSLNLQFLRSTDYYVKFNVDGLLRGDLKSRYEAYAIARNNGFLNANEIREREDLEPLPAGVGDTYWQPLNMVPVGETAPGEGAE